MIDGVEDDDARLMEIALAEARRCLEWGDVPVGAAVARGTDVLASGGNQRELLGDPTAHAELLALRAAAQQIGRWRLEGCTLYVTLEPCAMCCGAMVLARVRRLVFAAPDPKAGFAGSLGDLVRDPRLNHRLEVTSGVRSEEAAALLREFFGARRAVRVSDDRAFVLVHSPLVGPLTWNRVGEELEARGRRTVTPSLALSGAERGQPPYWAEHARAVARAVEAAGVEGPVVLVGHSGAGPLLPAIREALPNPVVAYVFVDAGLPRDGESRLDRFGAGAEEFRAGAVSGLLPAWTGDELRDVLPDEEIRRRFVEELRPVPLAVYEEPLPVFEGWPDAPCGYLRFGHNQAYDEPAEEARAAGWPVRELPGDHFQMLVDSAAVTEALLQLERILTR